MGSNDYKLYAFNPDGALKWSYATAGQISSSPAIGADGAIYVGSSDGNLYALEQDATPPAAPTLALPANGAKTASVAPTLDWSDVADPTGVTYSLQVDDNADFSSSNVSKSGLTSSDYTLASGEALPQGTYYWRVKARDGAGNESGWTASRSFSVDTAPPGVPAPVSPANGSVTTSATPALDWSDVSDVSSVTYRVQVDNNADFSSTEIDAAALSQSAYTPGIALAQGNQFWRLKTVDGVGNESPWTDAWMFSVDATPPTNPTNLTRTTSDYNNKPAFTWSASTDATSGMDYYELRLDSGSWVNIGNVTSYTWPDSISNASHNLNLRAVDKAGNASGSINISFNILPNQAPVAVITSPQNGSSYFITDNISFNGSQSSDPDGDTLAYEWSSSKDGILGTTTNLTKQLTSGSHAISLKVSDGKDGQNTASINITGKTQQALSVTWGDHSTPTNIKPGQMVGVSVTLTNTGTQTWPKGGANPVYVTYHWYNSSWQPVEWGIGLRSSFASDVASGQLVSITASLKSPSTTGSYNLIWDVVQEGVAWFSGQGAQLLTVSNITISASQQRDVQWVSHTTPTTIKPGQMVGVPITLTNTGSQTWLKSGANPVYVTYHWYNSSWQTVEWGIGLRSAFSQDVASGQMVSLTASLKAPSAAGTYNLIWDVIQEGVAWFSGQGAPILGVSGINVVASQPKDVQWISQNTPTTIKPGQMVGVPITLTNTGSQTWPKNGANPVYVTYHWYNASWQPVEWGIGLRSAFSQDVASGQMVNLTASLKAPPTAGTYNLLWDVVQEGVAWFSGQGAPILGVSNITVAATQEKDVQWVSHNTPGSLAANQQVNVTITLTNTGSQVWPQGGTNPVKISYHWLTSSGQIAVWDGLMTSFTVDVSTGQMVTLSANLWAPSGTGSYYLAWDLVHEGIGWFSSQGAPLLYTSNVTVQ